MAWLGVRTISVFLVGLLGGCKAEQGGLGTASGAGESSSGAGTTEADGAASTGSGTNVGSGDATVGSSSGGSGTGPADGTSTTGDDPPPPEGSGSSSAGETGTPVGEGEDYGPCAAGSSCSGPGSYCFAAAGGQDMCLPACEGGNPSCPDAPPDNGSLVECIEIPDGTNPHCMLNCAGGTACPEGTTCIDLGGIFRCLWP